MVSRRRVRSSSCAAWVNSASRSPKWNAPDSECGPALPHITYKPVDAAAKHWLVCVKQLGKPDGELCTALGYDVATFQKQAPNLVH